MMRSKYCYVRVGITSPGPDKVEVIVGVALNRTTDTLAEHYDATRRAVEARLAQLDNWWLLDDAQIAQSVEDAILTRWPDERSYFIEVGRGALSEYVQVFEP